MEKSKQGGIFPGWEDNSKFGGSLDLKLWNGLSELKKCEKNGERDIKTYICDRKIVIMLGKLKCTMN